MMQRMPPFTRWAVAFLVMTGGISVGHCSLPAAQARPSRRARFDRQVIATHFVRGNLHAHTNLSDGDSSPSSVITWYKSHGYGFLALTDHNVVSDPSAYASMQGSGFVLISGEEITMTGAGRQVHVNALCTRETIAGGTYASATDALLAAETSIKAQHGISLVNHPNFDWALRPRDVPAIGSAHLIEIASGHPYVHARGDGSHPSHERLWDLALTAGEDVMGAAVDDAHHYIESAEPPAYPGVGWVEVFADQTTPEAICHALRNGLLYSSTGVRLRRIVVSGDRYIVEPDERGARVVFVGEGGRELLHWEGITGAATYRLRGNEKYVRARIELSDGRRAWTPAVRVDVE
jgi:hypothetical protein